MRVVVACGPFEGLGPVGTGAAIARSWASLGAEVAVVPMAEAGADFAPAFAALAGANPECLLVTCPAQPGQASSAVVGQCVADALDGAGPEVCSVWVDVAGADWRDGGAGMLAALGATADVPLDRGVDALAGITRIDLSPVDARLAGRTLHVVVAPEQDAGHLTGMRGITAAHGHAHGTDPALMLAQDQALVDLAAACGRPELATTAGSGALGGVGFVALLTGGRVATGPSWCAELSGLADTIAQADLVVTGCDQLEFGTKGGALLPLVTGLAEQAMRPVVAVARHNWISAREMRTMGIEEGYTLSPSNQRLDGSEVTRACLSVARTWTW